MDEPVDILALALVTLFFVIPVVRGGVQAVRTGNPWAPFERRADGRAGALVPGRYFAGLRAPREGLRTQRGLVLRWGVWATVVVLFGGGALYNSFVR